MAYKKTPCTVLVWCIIIVVLVVSSEIYKAKADSDSMIIAIAECRGVCESIQPDFDCLHFCLSSCAEQSCTGNNFFFSFS